VDKGIARDRIIRRQMSKGSVMSSKRVLIVEDNELNMKLFHDLLECAGL